MLHAYAARFDVTGNVGKFLYFGIGLGRHRETLTPLGLILLTTKNTTELCHSDGTPRHSCSAKGHPKTSFRSRPVKLLLWMLGLTGSPWSPSMLRRPTIRLAVGVRYKLKLDALCLCCCYSSNHRPCLVPFYKIYTLSHQIFENMHGILLNNKK